MSVSTPLDLVWWVLCGALALLLPMGRLCTGAGEAQAKNHVHVALQRLGNFALGAGLFWVVGFGLLFGTGSALVGLTDYAPGAAEPDRAAFFVFQLAAAAAMAAIALGVAADRLALGPSLVLSVVTSALLYPVVGHWVLGGRRPAEGALGWLEAMGFHDDAGATSIHVLGATVAVVTVWQTGPKRDGRRRQPHNVVLVYFGSLLVFAGTLGLLLGASQAGPGAAPVFLSGLLTAAFAGISSMVVAYVRSATHIVSAESLAMGFVGGVVSVSAAPSAFPPWACALLGALTGALVFEAYARLAATGLSDAATVVATHGVAAAFGTLAAAPFVGAGGWGQLALQALGLFVTVGSAAGCTVAVLAVARVCFGGLLVPAAIERIGMNIAIHEVSSDLMDLVDTLAQGKSWPKA